MLLLSFDLFILFVLFFLFFFFFSSRRRHTRSKRDWSSDVCSSDLSGLFGHAGLYGARTDRTNEPLDRRPQRPLRAGRHVLRSEERRVGKECRSRWSRDQ